jgi:hypothetical protein
MTIEIYTNNINGEQVLTTQDLNLSGFSDYTGERVLLDQSPEFVKTTLIRTRNNWNLSNIRNLMERIENYSGISYIDIFKSKAIYNECK